jgi:hypothetical protein
MIQASSNGMNARARRGHLLGTLAQAALAGRRLD